MSAVCKETDLPVRAMLRLNDTYTTTGGELTRLVGLGEDYLAVGAEGRLLRLPDADLTVDVEVCAHLADALGGVPWTFHRAIDAVAGDHAGLAAAARAARPRRRAVGRVVAGHGQPGTRSSPTGRCATPTVAGLLMAGGGLRGEHVPWLVRAGVRQFQVGLRRCVRAAPGRRTSTRATSGPGGCCSTTPSDRAAGRPTG